VEDCVHRGCAARTPAQKTKSSRRKLQRKPVNYPTSEMVDNAIKNLKERGGSSLHAIKNYIAASYKVDWETLLPFILVYTRCNRKVKRLAMLCTNRQRCCLPLHMAVRLTPAVDSVQV
jgi:hypothetical protein